MKIYTIILSAGVLSLILTDIIRRVALSNRLIDAPNERSMHKVPTPRLGGIAILLTWFPGITLLYLHGSIEKEIFYALLSGLPIAIISIVDDIRSVSPLLRFSTHLISAILAFYFLGYLRPFATLDISFSLPILIYPFTIIAMVWFINLFNFMDGIDGFVGVETIYISFILFVFSGNIICLLLILCVTGFLFWNWPKAQIFLGDAGSTQLGFILIVLGIYFHNTFELSILNWIMIAAPFWFDATYTLYRRWRNNEKLSQPHKKHAYQRIVQYGYSHRRTLYILVLINSIIFIMILIYRELRYLKIPLTIITITGLMLLYHKVDKLFPFNKK